MAVTIEHDDRKDDTLCLGNEKGNGNIFL